MRIYLLSLLLLPALSIGANPADLEKLIGLQKAQSTTLDLSHADLRHYLFVPGKIDLQQANLSHSNLSGVKLDDMNLKNADLSFADLSDATLNHANLSGANLSHANLSNAKLIQVDLTQANLICTNLNQADLSGANFTSADISGASFINTLTNEIQGYDSVADHTIHCDD